MPRSIDGVSRFVSVTELSDYIDQLIELTRMPHELSPRGYTDPDRKRYMMGQRRALELVQRFINHN